MPLTDRQIEQYRRDGYVCPVAVMPAAEAAVLRRSLEDFEATQGGRLETGQRSRAFLLFKWLDDLIRDPRVLDPIEQLIGPDILWLLAAVATPAFAADVDELRGDILVAKNDAAGAVKAYESALAGDSMTSGARARVQMKLDDIGYSAGSDQSQ